ncbi:glucosaminidase domain-containing protein [Hydrogenovibrio sp. 3SP14C1]|uniref:glucosaminidase domain-containing protein n=1 Tax=Hydrogenovibrio sp. 3SP14C1 TaxID=3038774 RepID=UPI002415A310|nr:glucosaminidase domain-containing protein [Hydrogenovibrio sp. 3SP14C1]MDG4811518.1 glucosaminidase domain-containing protein [Hydrogenovibrio sp. 3SP14C1]
MKKIALTSPWVGLIGGLFLLTGCNEAPSSNTAEKPTSSVAAETSTSANPSISETKTPAKVEATPKKTAVKLPPPPQFKEFAAGPPRKDAFFKFMVPLIHQANQQVMQKRAHLKTLIAAQTLSKKDQAWLKKEGDLYGLENLDPNKAADLKALLVRIDVVPTSLALAQGANESAWGTSRFARQANNFFGQWCFSKGCGLVPKQRTKGAIHEVRAFDHPYFSVKSYIHNLNSHRTYAQLRKIRAQLRQQNQPLTGLKMTEGLVNYSARKHEYVKELKSMIRYNKLTQYNQTS